MIGLFIKTLFRYDPLDELMCILEEKESYRREARLTKQMLRQKKKRIKKSKKCGKYEKSQTEPAKMKLNTQRIEVNG